TLTGDVPLDMALSSAFIAVNGVFEHAEHKVKGFGTTGTSGTDTRTFVVSSGTAEQRVYVSTQVLTEVVYSNSPIFTPVPEPDTWTITIAGLGMLGALA